MRVRFYPRGNNSLEVGSPPHYETNGVIMNGWAGKILDIDLTTRAIKSYPLDEEMARLFLGGRGLGARLLWDLVGPEVEPLSAAERADLHQRPADCHRLPDQQPLLGHHQKPADRDGAGCQFGRFLGHAVQENRLRCVDRARPGRKPRSTSRSSRQGASFHDAAALWGKRVGETTGCLGPEQ